MRRAILVTGDARAVAEALAKTDGQGALLSRLRAPGPHSSDFFTFLPAPRIRVERKALKSSRNHLAGMNLAAALTRARPAQ